MRPRDRIEPVHKRRLREAEARAKRANARPVLWQQSRNDVLFNAQPFSQAGAFNAQPFEQAQVFSAGAPECFAESRMMSNPALKAWEGLCAAQEFAASVDGQKAEADWLASSKTPSFGERLMAFLKRFKQ